MTKSIALPFLALLVVTTPVAAEEKSRGEQLRQWRVQLEAARQAWQENDDSRAIEIYAAILAEAEARHEDGMLVARAVDGLADVYREQHRFDLAAPLYERSVESWTRLLGEAQPRRGVSLHNLGICYVELGDWAAAERVLDGALAVWRSAERYAGRIAETQRVLDAALARRSIPWNDAPR